ncbi:MAG: hypothetical protein EP315_03650 [Gammaproteobacteria bacterium]|nr:MAG: hypothetical protein EP315_03650 [Gammaproteobacteria bacterium]
MTDKISGNIFRLLCAHFSYKALILLTNTTMLCNVLLRIPLSRPAMKHVLRFMITLFSLTAIPLALHAASDHEARVQQLMQDTEAPDGVVFEIVNRNKRFLDWALPEAERLSQQLRQRFPQLDIAIVTHGSEQFALTKQQLDHNPALKKQLTELTGQNVQVHVCGTFAERQNIHAEDFSELVNVAAEGPAQINDYIKLGYIRIRINKK